MDKNVSLASHAGSEASGQGERRDPEPERAEPRQVDPREAEQQDPHAGQSDDPRVDPTPDRRQTGS